MSYHALIVVAGRPQIIHYKEVSKHIEGMKVEIRARDFWRQIPIEPGQGAKIMDWLPVGEAPRHPENGKTDKVLVVLKSRDLTGRNMIILSLCRSLILAKRD
jgi:hypothetical protein